MPYEDWLYLDGIPRPSNLPIPKKKIMEGNKGDKKRRKRRKRSQGEEGSNKSNHDLSPPRPVVKVPSINSDDDFMGDSEPFSKTNKRNSLENMKNTAEHYQHTLQKLMRKKMRESWLDTSYQRAIWNARRRLMKGEWMQDLPEHEKQMMSPLLAAQVKPDYSRWLVQKKKPNNAILDHLSIKEQEIQERTVMKQQHDQVAMHPSRFNIQNLRNMEDIGEIDYSSLQVYPVEFVSLSDRLTLHEPPWLAALRQGIHTETYENFGLCYGCFHQKGPHNHYLAPVRIGGGYSIYNPYNFQTSENGPGHVKLDTVRWIAEGDKQSESSMLDQEIRDVTGGDDFTFRLFHMFLDNGGDPDALQEYLESNFDPDLLKDFELMGMNVQLLKEYSELLRSHIREKMFMNLEKQSEIVKANDDDITLMKKFVEIAGSGGDLEMLLLLLEKGRNCDEIMDYERQGGNVEILEHYAEKLLYDSSKIVPKEDGHIQEETPEDTERKMTLIERLREYVEQEAEHKNANLLLEYMSKGGRLDVLVEYARRGASSPGILQYEATEGNLALVREYAEKFPNKDKLIRDVERFVKNHFRSYASAKLLQTFIENGGGVKVLKQYVRDGCSFSSSVVKSYVKDGGNVRLLQDIGDEFAKEQTIREDLEQFPDDPKILEAYIRRGGNFPRLVKAIADAMDDPLLEDYVKRKTDSTIHDMHRLNRKSKKGRERPRLIPRHSRSASGLLQTHTPRNSPEPETERDPRLTRSSSPRYLNEMLDSPSVLPQNLLPRLLENARAELKYDKLRATDEILRQNEGAFLAKAVALNREMVPVSSVTMSAQGRHLPISIWSSRSSKDSALYSAITGEKRPRLWKAPPPFMIKKSHIPLTHPESPFSRNRQYRIGSLTEDHILAIEKRQRQELDVLRRNYRSKDFHDNWRVAITSPEGSIISEHDSTIEEEFKETGPVKLKKSEEEKMKKKKDKASRRERQREKMKALKQERPGRSGSASRRRKKSASPSRPISGNSAASSSSHLSVPGVENTDALTTLPTEDTTVQSKPKETVEDKKTKARSRSRSRSAERKKPDPTSVKKTEVTKLYLPEVSRLHTPRQEDKSVQSENLEEGKNKDSESSTEEDDFIKHLEKPIDLKLPPLPVVSEVPEADGETSPSFQTAFGKTTPRTTPRNRETVMIEDPNTLLSLELEKEKQIEKVRAKPPSIPRNGESNRIRKPSVKRSSYEELISLGEDFTGSAVDDVLRKYCIIREERVPRYRHIFDKHLMLKELRARERAYKLQRARNVKNGANYEELLDEIFNTDGPVFAELKRQLFLGNALKMKIEDIQQEIAITQGNIGKATVLAARERLTNNETPSTSPRRTPKSNSRSVFGGSAKGYDWLNDDIDLVETGLTDEKSPRIDNRYNYNDSARPGFESSSPRTDSSPNVSTQFNGEDSTEYLDVPLPEHSDAKIMAMLSARDRKKLRNDPEVKRNEAVLFALQDKLRRTGQRERRNMELIERLKIEAEEEKILMEYEKEKKNKFTRQQSALYQALHPLDDPVLDPDDVAEALRDVNGEISRADSGVIFEALDFPRQGAGVNFRVFCILAALSESAVSIQPLVRRLSRTRDARALNVKMDKCKEIYGSLLGPNLESLKSEIRSSDFTSAQYRQVMRKLTRDGGRLSFLDFVTYVPLFLDIHQKIVANPLRA